MTYGPIDFIALEFDSQNLKGEILPELLDLVGDKIIRVIDLVIIRKSEDGSHEALELKQVDAELMEMFDPLEVDVTGIIQVEDIEAIAEAMDPGTAAAVLLIENLWALKFKAAVLRAEGRLLAQERIPDAVVDETLDLFARAEV